MVDGTKGTQDSSQSGDTSGDQQGTSQEFSKESQEKAVSDALSSAGREAKTLSEGQETVKKGLEELATKTVAFQKQQDNAEIEAAGGDAAIITRIRDGIAQRDKDVALDQRERDLNTKEGNLKPSLERATKQEIRERAEAVAKNEDVDIEHLIKFSDGSTESMIALAKTMQKKGEADPGATLHQPGKGSKEASKKTEEQKLKTRYPSM